MSFDAFNVKFEFFNLILHNLSNKFVGKVWISLQEVDFESHGLLVVGRL